MSFPMKMGRRKRARLGQALHTVSALEVWLMDRILHARLSLQKLCRLSDWNEQASGCISLSTCSIFTKAAVNWSQLKPPL